jgi:large repetitive protein
MINKKFYKSSIYFFVFIIISFIPFLSPAQDKRSGLPAPVASNDSILIGKNQEILINVLLNDLDTDNDIDPSSLQNTSNPLQGFLSIENNKFKYKPNPNYCGIDSFKYTVKDLLGQTSNIATVHIEISCLNLKPDAHNDTLITDEDLIDSVDAALNDNLNDGPEAIFSLLTLPLHGTAQLSLIGMLIYIPEQNFNGADSLKYVINDNDPTTTLTDTATIYFFIDPVNDAPIAINDTVITYKNTALTANITLNDSSIDGPQEIYSIIQTTTHGTSVMNNGVLNYDPSADYVGMDTLTYSFCDQASIDLCDTAYVYIHILPTYPLPVALNDELKIPVNETGAINIITNDFSANGLLISSSVNFISLPLHGTITYLDSIVTYTPPNGFTGRDSCAYTITDQIDSVSNIAKILFIINQPPQAGNVCNNEGIANEEIVIPIFSNTISGTVTVDESTVLIVTGPDHGELSAYNPINQTIIYFPDPGYAGTDTFYFQVYDTDGFISDTAYACITIKEGLPLYPQAMLTPNNDGRNDVWLIPGIENFPDNELVILDRYTNEVFHTKNYSSINNWDGNNLPAGTYFYLLKVIHNGKEELMKGYLTLLK